MAETTLFDVETPLRGTATISPCGTYRYDLTRDWGPDGSARRVCFVMLNPSKADANRADPTMTRCVNFARSWGYDGMVIVNLFALKATNPSELRSHSKPIGESNDMFVCAKAASAELVVCAWGAKGSYLDRDRFVLTQLRRLCTPKCLRLTKGGHPEHPLYLPAELKPFDLPEPALKGR